MDVRQLTPIIGAEVFGLDIANECSDDLIANLRALLLRHGVLVFRDQWSLTRDSHIAFACRFGQLEAYPGGEPTHPEIIRIVHDAEAPPTENVWHSDMSFRPDPPLGSLLRAMVIPWRAVTRSSRTCAKPGLACRKVFVSWCAASPLSMNREARQRSHGAAASRGRASHTATGGSSPS